MYYVMINSVYERIRQISIKIKYSSYNCDYTYTIVDFTKSPIFKCPGLFLFLPLQGRVQVRRQQLGRRRDRKRLQRVQVVVRQRGQGIRIHPDQGQYCDVISRIRWIKQILKWKFEVTWKFLTNLRWILSCQLLSLLQGLIGCYFF